MDLATGLCVQGGAPLIGGRGMLADALCLWIAAALPASETESIRAARGRRGSDTVSCTDRGVLAKTAEPDLGLAGQRDHRRVAPTLSARSLPPHTSRIGGTDTMCMPVADWCTTGQTMDRTHQQSRSLSYLSLTLRCIAPRSGWRGGCAPLHREPSEPDTGNSVSGTACRTDGKMGATAPPSARLTRRIRPALL